MYHILRSSINAMSANQSKIDVISGNIANSQTVGYKTLEAGFVDLYIDSLNISSYPTDSENLVAGTGVKLTTPSRNQSQGSLKNTEVSTDIAIDGDGYFRLTSNGNTYYTRNGEFLIDVEGKIVDVNGNYLDITYNEGVDLTTLNFANGELSIAKDGSISLDGVDIGVIELFMPQGTMDFLSAKENLFVLKEGATVYTVDEPSLIQGAVEMSNTDLSSEMTDMIVAQRNYQLNRRAANAVDEMWEMINNLRSR
jgi:flagellar basal-body rod protein FlgG